jgi:hypothetical protein
MAAYELAVELWKEAQNDPAFVGVLRSELSSLVRGMALGTATGDIINASKNGASYTMRPSVTLNARKEAISYALWCIDNNMQPTRTRRVIFTTSANESC